MKIKLLHECATLPIRGSSLSAGADVTSIEAVTIYPNEHKVVSTGISVQPYEGYYIQILARSGLAAKNGIAVFGGVIDADYKGEVKVILHNSGDIPFDIDIGDRIAQLLEIPVRIEPIELVNDLTGEDRGGGFGSTGLN